jgi:hypothetical protein
MKYMLFICTQVGQYNQNCILYNNFSFLTKKYLAELEYKRQKGLPETWKTLLMMTIAHRSVCFYFMTADLKGVSVMYC